MNKWWLLLLITLCLTGVGLVIFVLPEDKNHSAPPLPGRIDRIVSLAPNITEILFELGLGEKIAAVSSDSDYPDEASAKKKVGTFWQPNIESVIAAKPNLVIALWFEQQRAIVESLKRLGYQVLSLRIEKIEELSIAIRKIGAAAGCQQRANELAKQIRKRLNKLRLKLGPIDKTRTLWVVQVEPLRVAGRNTFVNELIEMAGGENAIGPTIQQYPLIGTEELITCGAEVIIQSAMGTGRISEQQQAAEVFWSKRPNLAAVKNDRIYVVDSDMVLRLGPRLPHGVEMIARCLHPEIFKQGSETVREMR
ncbi:MAG: ABC transporter substrate-binding protein [Planctomycetota bacterium]|jgi:iron complex transport system substrate-binding protein